MWQWRWQQNGGMVNPRPPPLPHPRPHLHLLPQYFGSFGNEFLWRDFYVSIIPGTGAWLQGGAAKWGEW